MNYQAIVTAGLAVTGTLAGVYFATVAFVVSTTYRDATARVRSLVTRIPEGRAYTFAFVQAVLFALAILLLPLADTEPNRLALLTLAMLAALVVASFGRLRTQLYGLLEPAGLLVVVRSDLARWTRYAIRARNDSRKWRLLTSRARVLHSLATLRDLCRLIREREHMAPDSNSEYATVDPRVASAVSSVTAIWLNYASKKHRLVDAREWCLPRDRHKDWLIANEFEIGIALGTATTLRPETSDDQTWLERHLASVLEDLLAGRDAAQFGRLAGDLSPMPRELMSRGLFDDTRLWLDVVVQPAGDLIVMSPTDSNEDVVGLGRPGRAAVAQQHNLVDFLVLSYSQTALGLTDYANELTRDFPSWSTRQARGEAARRVGPGPSALFRNLEDGLAFERTVEGETVTSAANIHQLVARSISTELIDQATWLVDTLQNSLVPWVLRLCESPTLPAAAALSRTDETLHKAADVLLPALERCFSACESVHRDVDDTWPDHDTTALQNRISTMSADLRLPIARLASLTEVDMNPDRPDAFGWAFLRAHDDLLDDVLGGEPRLDMRDRLDLLAIATDRATMRVQESVRRTHVRVANSYAAEPLLLLLQVSGMAYVQGMLNGRSSLFNAFSDMWTRLLAADAQVVIDLSMRAIGADDQLFGISPGKMIRSGRADRAMRAFEFLGEDEPFGFRRRARRSRPGGELEPRAAEIASHLSLRRDFEEIFVAAWLLPEALARGATRRDELISHPLFKSLVDAFATLDESADVPLNRDDMRDGPHGEADNS